MKLESKKHAHKIWLLASALWLAGCGARENEADTMSASSGQLSSGSAGAAASNAPVAARDSSDESSSNAKAVGAGVQSTLIQSASQTPRKIIYTATVDAVVENLSTAQTSLTRLVKANNGYIAETNVGGESGAQRSGTWKVRVPVERYEAFMAGATRLGELQKINSNSQDVSAEYYDVAARITNKEVEEKRLLRHLQVSTGKLNEILQVERELSRVRGEIEQLQGRIRVLANLSSLTTVTLTLREIKNYVPPKPPTFATEIARQFGASLHGLGQTAKAFVLMFVALSPWLLLAAIIGLPLRWLRRRSLQRKIGVASPPSPNTP